MEIKVYKDGSKQKTKIVAGLDARQILSLGGVALVVVGMAADTFFLHLPDVLIQPLSALLLAGFMALSFFKKDGLPFERYLKLWIKFYLLQKTRTYQTERIKKYTRNEFRQDRTVNETDGPESTETN